MPDQHGAWAMLVVPPLLGMLHGGGSWRHLPLFVAWFVGYLAFHAWTLWFKTKAPRRAQYLPPLLTYGTVSALATAVTLVSAPGLLGWAVAFGPLFGLAIGEVWRHAERSLLSGFATVLAAGLLTPIAVSVSPAASAELAAPPTAGPGWTQWLTHQLGFPGLGMSPSGWLITALLTGYFLGTVLHVKALIRKRRSRGHFAASVVWHVAMLGTVVLLALVPGLVVGVGSGPLWGQVAVWLLLTGRAAIMPARQHRGNKPFSPRFIGLLEMGATLLVTGTLLLF
ncbi:YwiC-like family protein [Buchananella hordeovulneris]|nr:YwiC-like family protein [Buchananella hordeovulneris]